MTERQFTQCLADAAGIPYTSAVELTGTVFRFLTEKILEGEEVRITNFGQFKLRYQPGKVKLDNLSREVRQVDSKMVLRFVPTRKFEKDLRNLV